MISSVTEFFELLGRDPNELIGQPETEWLDFKGETYQLTGSSVQREKACFELAKDVTAFANQDEGVILIGVKTKKDPARHEEVATKLRAVPPGAVDPKQVQDVIRDWAFPALDVEIRPHAILGNKGELWTIYVKRQRERDMPFIVAKEFTGSHGANRNLFGVYGRSDSQNRPYAPAQVWSWIHLGWSSPTEEAPILITVPTDEADRVLSDDLVAIGLDPQASAYYLQAMPRDPARLQRFYRGAANSLHETLLNIPHLRAAGFNLPDGLQPERTASGALRVVWRQSDSVSITLGGLATAIQGQEHLTWAYEKVAPPGKWWINPLALVEFTLDFWRFYVGQIQSRMESVPPTIWRAGMRGLEDPEPLYLPSSFSHGSPSERARVNAFALPWSTTEGRDPGCLAFEVLSEIYSRFGFDEAVIPYAEERCVSEQSILAIKRGS